ncbi:MAG: cobalt-precorrin-6A reductase [Acidimicrobiia bacterium]
MKVLLLAGTAEARALSHALDALVDVDVVVSLAGRTSAAADHGGTLRVGGFGGVEGLEAYVLQERFDAVVDATHPFAARMSAQVARAVRRTGTPLVRFERPPWRAQVGDRWTEVADVGAAARAVTALDATRVLLTIGRTGLDAFRSLDHIHFVVRSIEAVDRSQLASVSSIRARGPFTVADEIALLERHAIDAVVTKNSGGDDAKLVAARTRDLPIVMIERPARAHCTTVDNLEDALRWLRSVEHA